MTGSIKYGANPAPHDAYLLSRQTDPLIKAFLYTYIGIPRTSAKAPIIIIFWSELAFSISNIYSSFLTKQHGGDSRSNRNSSPNWWRADSNSKGSDGMDRTGKIGSFVCLPSGPLFQGYDRVSEDGSDG